MKRGRPLDTESAHRILAERGVPEAYRDDIILWASLPPVTMKGTWRFLGVVIAGPLLFFGGVFLCWLHYLAVLEANAAQAAGKLGAELAYANNWGILLGLLGAFAVAGAVEPAMPRLIGWADEDLRAGWSTTLLSRGWRSIFMQHNIRAERHRATDVTGFLRAVMFRSMRWRILAAAVLAPIGVAAVAMDTYNFTIAAPDALHFHRPWPLENTRRDWSGVTAVEIKCFTSRGEYELQYKADFADGDGFDLGNRFVLGPIKNDAPAFFAALEQIDARLPPGAPRSVNLGNAAASECLRHWESAIPDGARRLANLMRVAIARVRATE